MSVISGICLGLGVLMAGALVMWRISQYQLRKTREVLAEIKQQKKVAETQLNNQRERQKNEEISHIRSRTALLERMHEQGDLRD